MSGEAEMMGWGVGGGALMLILIVMFWVAIIVAVVFLVRALVSRPAGTQEQPHRDDGALRILEERYAKGELEREEFLRRRDDLRL